MSRVMLVVVLVAFGSGLVCAEAGGFLGRGASHLDVAVLRWPILFPLSSRVPFALAGTIIAVGLLWLRWRTGQPRLRRGRAWRLVWAATFLAFMAGGLRLDTRLAAAALDRGRAEKAADVGPETIRRLVARVASRTDRAWGAEFVLTEVSARDDGPSLPRRLMLRLSPLAPGSRGNQILWPGQRVQLGARIAPLSAPRNPGSTDREKRAALRGLGAQARLASPEWVVAIEDRAWRLPSLHALRAAIRDRIAARFAIRDGSNGLALALAIGDRRSLDPASVDAFRALGLSHLIAISGLHVGLVAGAVGWWAVRSRSRWPRRAATGPGGFFGILTGGVAAWIYAWLSGASPAVTRAALAFGIVGAARLLGRGISSASLLCLVALALLAAEPALLFDLGAQLSFAACAGILFVGLGRTRGESVADVASSARGRWAPGNWLPRLRRGTHEALAISLAASFATGPWLVRADLPLAVLGPVVNLAAIPVTAFIVLPASLLAALLAGLDITLFDGAISLLLVPAAAFESLALAVAPAMPAEVAIGDVAVGWAGGLALLGLWRVRRRGVVGALVIWGAIWVASGGTPPTGDGALVDPPRLVFLDVGQGDSALIQGRGGNVLIDAGGGLPGGGAGKRVVRAIRALGVRGLDLLIVTHGDSDHRAGASRVLAEFEVGEVWLPLGAEGDLRLASLAREARALSVPVRWVAEGLVETRGDIGLEVLWPPVSGAVVSSRNEGSIVLQVDVAGIRSIFTADIGAEVERRLIAGVADLAADVLKVGHHGSRHSTSEAFVEAVHPQVAILSAPCRPTRGLPHPRIFGLLVDQGISIHWTGREGAISVGPADELRERSGVESPWGSAVGAAAGRHTVMESVSASGQVFRAVAWASPRACPTGG